MGSHRHLRFPSMSFIYKCSFRKPEWCFCFSRFGEESFFASTVTRLKPALSVFSIAIELKLIIACKGTDNKLVSQDGFHRTLTFNVAPQVALDILRDVATTIDDAEIILYCDNKPITEKHHKKREVKRSRFKFSMCGIKIGELLTFIPTGAIVKVASDDSIEHDGRIYKLSPFVGTFMPEDKRNTSGAYQGAKYFSYEGFILDDLRKQKEESHDSEL